MIEQEKKSAAVETVFTWGLMTFLREYGEGIIKAYSLTLGIYLMVLFFMEKLVPYAS